MMWIKQNPYETLDETASLAPLLNEGRIPMKERKAKSAHG